MTTTDGNEDVAQRLAAAIADAETQHKHYAARRLHLWAKARELGWTFDEIAAAAGVHRTAVFSGLKRAGLLVPTKKAQPSQATTKRGESDE